MLMTVLSPEQAIEFMKLDEYNKGIEDGEVRGIEIGEVRGERRGIEIGKHNTSLNFAKTMLKNNYRIYKNPRIYVSINAGVLLEFTN